MHVVHNQLPVLGPIPNAVLAPVHTISTVAPSAVERPRLASRMAASRSGASIVSYSDFGVETAWSRPFFKDRLFAFRSPCASF